MDKGAFFFSQGGVLALYRADNQVRPHTHTHTLQLKAHTTPFARSPFHNTILLLYAFPINR